MLIVPNSVSLRLMILMLVASNAQISLATSAKNKEKKSKKSGFMVIILNGIRRKRMNLYKTYVEDCGVFSDIHFTFRVPLY